MKRLERRVQTLSADACYGGRAFQLHPLGQIAIAYSIARPAALIGAAFLAISLSTNFCK
jgi:hypothetical protein